jgi:hypothetical protein
MEPLMPISKYLFITLLLLAENTQAEIVSSSATRIIEINSYSNFPDGDTLFAVETPHPSCPGGYWLKMSDLGFSKNLSILLSSFHAQSKIIFYADNSSIWPHNPIAQCHISQIKLIR